MFELFNNHNFLYFIFVLFNAFIRSNCANSDSAPAVSGVYDIIPDYRIMNYRFHNTLHCNITGVSKPEDYTIHWYYQNQKLEPKEDDPHYEIKGDDLIIKAVHDDLMKEPYRCDLVLKSTKESVSSATFKLLGKLTVKIVSQGTFIQGQKILLECQVQGFPEPQIEWRYQNTTFGSTYGRFVLKDNLDKGLRNNYLQIDEAELSDRGEYGCKASNDHLNTEAVIFVRVKDKYAALWPFIGICAEVVVLCAIIFVYERKRNKAELDESDTDQSPEQKNTPDHGKESVRQRK